LISEPAGFILAVVDGKLDIDVMIVVDMDEAELGGFEALFTDFLSDASLEGVAFNIPAATVSNA
jgi:hypothetical protein